MLLAKAAILTQYWIHIQHFSPSVGRFVICDEADINQKPVQTPCHLAVVVRVLSSILNAPSTLAHPALTLFSYLILETLTCVLSSQSLALSNLIFINAVTLLYQICISLPTLLTFILVLFSKCALCECSHSCLSIKILCLPAWFTKLFHKILWSPSVGSASVSNFLLDSIFQKNGLYFLNTLSQAPIHHI